jgi:integrase/recombinase XerD
MGSAPIKTSVRCENLSSKKVIKKKLSNENVSLVRDLYNREKKVEKVIKRVKEIDEPDRSDILTLVDHMKVNELSALWLVRCIGDLLRLRKPLGKPFREATPEDIKLILEWIKSEGYETASDEKFRQVLKKFYKVVFGNNKVHPEQVNFFNSQVGHDRKSKKITYEQVLSEEQIKLIIDTAPTLQEKVFCACLYETGARPEEFLRLTNLDINDNTHVGMDVILRGKTGERVVSIIAYAPLLLQWLDVHPLKKDNLFSLWLSESTNFKNEPLGIAGAEKRVRKIFELAGLEKKKIPKLYTFRHTRATHLANIMTHAQMCYNFGWTQDSDKPTTYIHLSGGDTRRALEAAHTNIERITTRPATAAVQLCTSDCTRCKEKLHSNASFCYRCGLKTNIPEIYEEKQTLAYQNKRIATLEAKQKYLEKNYIQAMILLGQIHRNGSIKMNDNEEYILEKEDKSRTLPKYRMLSLRDLEIQREAWEAQIEEDKGLSEEEIRQLEEKSLLLHKKVENDLRENPDTSNIYHEYDKDGNIIVKIR